MKAMFSEAQGCLATHRPPGRQQNGHSVYSRTQHRHPPGGRLPLLLGLHVPQQAEGVGRLAPAPAADGVAQPGCGAAPHGPAQAGLPTPLPATGLLPMLHAQHSPLHHLSFCCFSLETRQHMGALEDVRWAWNSRPGSGLRSPPSRPHAGAAALSTGYQKARSAPPQKRTKWHFSGPGFVSCSVCSVIGLLGCSFQERTEQTVL